MIILGRKGGTMVINCYLTKNCDVATRLANELNDDVLYLEERVLRNDFSPIFSGKAYVLVINYDKIFNLNALTQLYNTTFKGSKVLYCIFTGKRKNKNMFSFAKKIADVTGLILFGIEYICTKKDGTVVDFYNQTIESVVLYTKDMIPFDFNSALTFPYRKFAHS